VSNGDYDVVSNGNYDVVRNGMKMETYWKECERKSSWSN